MKLPKPSSVSLECWTVASATVGRLQLAFPGTKFALLGFDSQGATWAAFAKSWRTTPFHTLNNIQKWMKGEAFVTLAGEQIKPSTSVTKNRDGSAVLFYSFETDKRRRITLSVMLIESMGTILVTAEG